MSPKLLGAILLSLLIAAVQRTNGEQIQFDASHLLNCTYEHSCIYSWNNSTTWIGGKVPSPTDDVNINIGNNFVIITCDNNCVAKNIQTSGQHLAFQLPSTTVANFEQINATSGIIEFEGGSLTVKDFVKPHSAVIISAFTNTQITVDTMELTTAAFVKSAVQIRTISLQTIQLFASQFVSQYEADLFDILSIEQSSLTFQGGCSVQGQTASQVINSTIFSTPACPLMLNSISIFYNSIWTIESHQPAQYTIGSQFVLNNSTIKLTGVKLIVKSDVRLRQNSVIEADIPVEVSYYGRIGGQGTVMADLVVKNFGRIQGVYGSGEEFVSHMQLTIMGTLSIDRSSTVHLQNAESIQANSILLSDPSLEISLFPWNWTAAEVNYTMMTSRQGEISGNFDYINVTMALGYYQLLTTKSDLTLIWQLNQPAPTAPHSVNPPYSVNPPVIPQVPISFSPEISAPGNEVHPPVSEPNSSSEGPDTKTVIIVIESVMLGIGLILGGALVYRRFKQRRGYTEVPSFDQL